MLPFLLLASPVLLASSEGTPPMVAPSVEFPSVAAPGDRIHVLPGEDDYWIRGATYKAHAAPDGFSYVPFLGSDAPRNWPLELRVGAVAVGGAPLELSAEAMVRRDGETFVLDRGAVRAHYVSAPDGVEQLFEVDLGGHEGAVVLELETHTDLEVEPTAEGVRYAGPWGGVEYGAAFVVDRGGARVPIAAEHTRGAVRLTVPRDVVAAAGETLVIDPVLGTYAVGAPGTVSRTFPDVAFDSHTGRYVHVMSETFSLLDVDCYLVQQSYPTPSFDALYVNLNAEAWAVPRIACVAGADRYLVVCERRAINARTVVVGQLVDADPLALFGSPLVIANAGSPFAVFDETGPDVGGNGTGVPGGMFCVVWERESTFSGDSWACARPVAADGTLGTHVDLGPVAGMSQGPVMISECTGDTTTANDFAVVFAEEDRTTGADRVRSAVLFADGSLRAAPTTIHELGALGDVLSLDVSSFVPVLFGSPVALAVYVADNASNTVIATSFRQTGQQRGQIDLVRAEHGPRSPERTEARVASTEAAFVVAYAEEAQAPGGAGTAVVASTVQPHSDGALAVGERRLAVRPAVTQAAGPIAVASAFSGGAFTDSRVAIDRSEWDATLGRYELRGALFQASDIDSPAMQFCDGEPNSTGERAFLRMRGQRWSTLAKTVLAEGLPANTFTLLVCGTQPANVFGPGGSAGRLCLGGTLGRFNSQVRPASSQGLVEFDLDPTHMPLGNGHIAATAGTVLHFQVWYRDQAGGTQTSNFTNAVTLSFL